MKRCFEFSLVTTEPASTHDQFSVSETVNDYAGISSSILRVWIPRSIPDHENIPHRWDIGDPKEFFQRAITDLRPLIGLSDSFLLVRRRRRLLNRFLPDVPQRFLGVPELSH